MKFCIFIPVKNRFKTLAQWNEPQILAEAEKRLGKEKAEVLKEIIKEFKKITITIP